MQQTFSILAAIAAALSLATATAVAQPAPGGWQPGPGAPEDAASTRSGFIDIPTGSATEPAGRTFLIAGWFVDSTAEGWAGADDVQVYSGPMGAGGTLLARGLVGQNRPDVGAALNNPFWSASGWSAAVAVPAGTTTLLVYLHTPGKGWWFRHLPVVGVPSTTAIQPQPAPGGSPVNVIVEPRAAQNLGTAVDFELRGYALDPAAAPNQGSQGTGIDQVQVYLNGPRGDPASTFLGNAWLAFSDATATARYGPQFTASGWRLTLKTTSLHANAYTVYAYAHSAVTGLESVSRVGFQIVEGRV